MKRGWTFVRCAGCGLISVRPLPTAEALRAHVEQSYQDSTYAVYAAAEAIRAGIARHRMEIVAPMAPPGPWLEVGCATGALLAAARRAGFNAEGLDVSAFSVARARAEGLIVHHRAVEDFVPMQRYAVVAAFDVIEHLPDPIAFVERVGTWLEPGGLFVLTLPNAASALFAACLAVGFFAPSIFFVESYLPVDARLARHHNALSVRRKRSPSDAAREAFVGSLTELVASNSNLAVARSTKTSPDWLGT